MPEIQILYTGKKSMKSVCKSAHVIIKRKAVAFKKALTSVKTDLGVPFEPIR